MTKMVLVGLMVVGLGALSCEQSRSAGEASRTPAPQTVKDEPRVSPPSRASARDELIHLSGPERPTSYVLIDLIPDEARGCAHQRITCQGELTADDLTRTSSGWRVFAPRNCRPSLITHGKLTHLWVVTRAGVSRIARHDCLGSHPDDDHTYVAWPRCSDDRIVAQLNTL